MCTRQMWDLLVLNGAHSSQRVGRVFRTSESALQVGHRSQNVTLDMRAIEYVPFWCTYRTRWSNPSTLSYALGMEVVYYVLLCGLFASWWW